jgi:hypothetical protein
MAHGRPTRFYWHVLFAGHTLEIFPESLKVWVQKYPPYRFLIIIGLNTGYAKAVKVTTALEQLLAFLYETERL